MSCCKTLELGLPPRPHRPWESTLDAEIACKRRLLDAERAQAWRLGAGRSQVQILSSRLLVAFTVAFQDPGPSAVACSP
jgi:hypothetical protein